MKKNNNDLPDDYEVAGQINIKEWLMESKPEALPRAWKEGKAENGTLPCRKCLNRSGSSCGKSHSLHYEGRDLYCDGFLPADFMNPPEE